MNNQPLADFDVAIAEVTFLGLKGDVGGATALVDLLANAAAESTFLSARLQARLLHAAMDDPRMPSALLAALIDRFRWADLGSALDRFHPDQRERVIRRVTAARTWLNGVKTAAQRLDGVGEAARAVLYFRAAPFDCNRLSSIGRRTLENYVNGARRFGPLLGDEIDCSWIEFLDQSLHPNANPPPGSQGGGARFGDAAKHVNVKGSRLPEGARWAVALAAMYSLVHKGTDATLEPFDPSERPRSVVMLRDFWGVDAPSPFARHEQTVRVLEWLIHHGSRADPQYAEPGDPEAALDLLAWDIARASMVARHAVLAGCLAESEAWAYLRNMATKAQTSFESWRDYGSRYTRGRIRWSGALHDEFDDAVEFLLASPQSPWRTLDWGTRLDEETVRGAPEAGPLGRAAIRLRQAWRENGQSRVRFGVVTMVGLMAFGWEITQALNSAPIPVSRNDPGAPPSAAKPLDEYSARGEFAKIQVVFYSYGGYIQARFRAAPFFHPVTEFRFGVDKDAPDRVLSGKQAEAAVNGVPESLDAPVGARFITFQARLDDGSLSPIRRFDVSRDITRSGR